MTQIPVASFHPIDWFLVVTEINRGQLSRQEDSEEEKKEKEEKEEEKEEKEKEDEPEKKDSDDEKEEEKKKASDSILADVLESDWKFFLKKKIGVNHRCQHW